MRTTSHFPLTFVVILLQMLSLLVVEVTAKYRMLDLLFFMSYGP
jgi:hypothetical protein